MAEQKSLSASSGNANDNGLNAVMQMLAQIAQSGRSRNNRDKRIENIYDATAAANIGVNNPTGRRRGGSKGSGGRPSGQKKQELRNSANNRANNKANRKQEFIKTNTARTAERKKDRLYRSADREADKALAGIEKDRGIVRDIKAGRERDAAYKKQQPLDALTLLRQAQGEPQTPINLPETGSYAPQGDAYESVMMPGGTIAPMGPESMTVPTAAPPPHVLRRPGRDDPQDFDLHPDPGRMRYADFDDAWANKMAPPAQPIGPSNYADFDDARARDSGPPAQPIGHNNYADFDDQRARDSGPPAGPPRPHTGGIPGVNYADFDDQTPPVRQQLPGVGGMYQDNPLYPFSMNGRGAYDTYPDFMTRPEHHPGQNQMRNMPQGKTLEEQGTMNMPLPLQQQHQQDMRNFGPGNPIPYNGYNPLGYLFPRRVPMPVQGRPDMMQQGRYQVPLRPY